MKLQLMEPLGLRGVDLTTTYTLKNDRGDARVKRNITV